jgi:hypothetical protein
MTPREATARATARAKTTADPYGMTNKRNGNGKSKGGGRSVTV